MDRSAWTDARLNERFDRIDDRFDRIDATLIRLEERMIRLDDRVFRVLLAMLGLYGTSVVALLTTLAT